MSYKIPFVDPKLHYKRLRKQILNKIDDTLGRGDLILRSQLAQFEKHIAKLVGVKYAIGVNSGYDALHLAVQAAGLGPNDEVITVAHTFVASISAIANHGATPVLIDVGQDYNMNMDLLEAAITPRTKAIMPVHLNGRMCDMDRLMAIAKKHNLVVIEDAAQALGAKFKGKMAGSFGLAGCFSFYPFKMLGACGDAGIITTNDPEVAQKTTLLRYNGEDRVSRKFVYHGYTALLDNVQAVILDLKLKYFAKWVTRRREIAKIYQKGLTDIGDLQLPHWPDKRYFDIYQNYVIRTKKRNGLVKHLEKSGVETIISWPEPIYQHQVLQPNNYRLPETEAICREVVSLPINTEINQTQVKSVIKYIREFFGKNG